ncbi:hypothetical protein [Candidatus Ichthyocystis sparus]|nr:hypothetical protein [Candidatus Ichthyocystis sparus]
MRTITCVDIFPDDGSNVEVGYEIGLMIVLDLSMYDFPLDSPQL